jgi:hypothetical protein
MLQTATLMGAGETLASELTDASPSKEEKSLSDKR